MGGSGGGWLGSGIGGSSKVERAEAKYDVTVDCEWFYASFFLTCRSWGSIARSEADIVRVYCLSPSSCTALGHGPILLNSVTN